MNFKALAIAAGLVFAAGSTFATDIVMSSSTTNDIATTAPLTDVVASVADLGNAQGATTAVIIQEGAAGVAYIEQSDAGAGLNFAAIFQKAAASTVAYVSQGATATNSRAVIYQK